MFKKASEASCTRFRSHPGICMGMLILLTFGVFCLSAYCDSVYIGRRAFVFKIIGMLISLLATSFFCWGLLHIRARKSSSGFSKRHPRLYRCGRVSYVLVIVLAFFVLSLRIAYPVMADLIHGPETAVVSYSATDSEKRKAGRRSGSYTLYHLYFRDSDGRQICINLTNREFAVYYEYFVSLQQEELTFYPHTHVAILPETALR